jgi:hypothetical protein
MKSSLFVAAICAAGILPLSAAAKIERHVEKTFSVQPGGRLSIDTEGGNIEVTVAETNQVTVVAQELIKASSDHEADELLKNLKLEIGAINEGVSATAHYEKTHSGLFSWFSGSGIQVNFIVTVPARYDLKLRTAGGNIAIGDAHGLVHARTSGGNISAGKITGEIDAKTSGGDLRLSEASGSAKLSTSGGNIFVGRVMAGADLDTSGGDIKIDSIDSFVHASTSGGNVTVDSIASLKADSELETSGGNVRVGVSSTFACNLNATTSGGEVKADGLTITTDQGGSGRDKLIGKVNGGGPVLRLHSSGGDISLRMR